MKQLIEYLRKLAETDELPAACDRGICGILYFGEYRTSLKNAREIVRLMHRWPEHSGKTHYPVPHPQYTEDSEYGYDVDPDKWEGAYGAARRRLCSFLADELSKDN